MRLFSYPFRSASVGVLAVVALSVRLTAAPSSPAASIAPASDASVPSSAAETRAWAATVGGTPDPSFADNDAEMIMAEVEAEQELIGAATRTAAVGDVAAAWKTLEGAPAMRLGRSGFSPALVGYRALSVGGFLHNVGRYAEAKSLGRLALAGAWSNPRNAPAGAERAQVRFWRAAIAANLLEDRELALGWAEEKDTNDEDARMPALRERLRNEVASLRQR